MRRRLALISSIAAAIVVGGCSGGSSTPTPPTDAGTITSRPAPDLSAFLSLPRATPSACPTTQNGTTIGRSSPWVGTVDVSVFLTPTATRQQRLALRHQLRTDPLVAHVYFESQQQAYQEFQRLYTCWTSVPRSQTPASYRLVLTGKATLATRDLLVARLAKQPAVDSVSCDPAVPCVNAAAGKAGTSGGSGSPSPTPVASHTHRR